jgi:carbon starvation protein
MNSVLAIVIGAVAIALGYGVYAKTINTNILQPDDKKATPAKMYMDGVDFAPANRNVLFGYQFKSIAALGPILGPIVAVQWGWLPALLWIVVGTFFIGWVQDYASIIMGVREEGQSFGALSYRLVSPRSRSISELWRGNPEKSNGDSKLETTRKLALASTHNPDQRRGNDVR